MAEKKKINIVIWCPYPRDTAPSQRFRFEIFLSPGVDQDLSVVQLAFLTARGWRNLYQDRPSARLAAFVTGLFRRIGHLFQSRKADYILLHREAAPLGPPVFEWLLARILQKKIIYDFDDAIWLPDSKEGALWQYLKWRSKVARSCSWSWKVSAGNDFLARYARSYASNVNVIPTVVDTEESHNPSLFQRNKNPTPVLGWTGSQSTLPYLDQMWPILEQLYQNHTFTFRVIANQAPAKAYKWLEFVPWNKHREVEDLMAIDVGIMPLPDDPWSEGKCGFKLIQYGALGIPSVAAPVGVNQQIFSDGENGFLASNPKAWIQALEKLLKDPQLRKEMGSKARVQVQNHYSKAAVAADFRSLFR